MGKRYVGERILQNCGEYAEIVELLPKGMCRVRFDSGIEKICVRSSFVIGNTSSTGKFKRHVGERMLQNCGEYAEIIELLSNNRCKVRFDSGIEKICTRCSFSIGEVANNVKRRYKVGDRLLQKCGEYAEIIELLPNNRCKVRFDSGFERDCSRGALYKGVVTDNNRMSRYVGERVLQNCGEWAEIIELLPKGGCIIRFDTGLEVSCNRGVFADGRVPYKRVKSTKRFIGEKLLQTCGMEAEVVELLDGNKCKIRFIDGCTCICCRSAFKVCSVLHPLLYNLAGKRMYGYRKTHETVLGFYFDKSIKHYVGVLRRSDGTRYVRVLD